MLVQICHRMETMARRVATVALLSVTISTITVVAEVTTSRHFSEPSDDMTSQEDMTASDRVRSPLNLMTEHSLGLFVSSSALNQTTLQPPEVHKLGIVTSISDENTMAIMRSLENEHIIFEKVDMTSNLSSTLDSYRKALKDVRFQHVAAVIGPFHPEYAVACQHERVPYLVTSQLPSSEKNPFLIELFPNYHVFCKSVLDMLNYYNFKKVAVVYDSDAGAAILETLSQQPHMEVTGLRVESQDLNVRLVRHALKSMRDEYFVSYVTVLSAYVTRDVMDQALSLSMFSTPTYKWILVNTGLTEFSLEKYADSKANITVLRLMMDYESCAMEPDVINLQRAILHDAVSVYVTYVSTRKNMSHFSMRRTNRQMVVDGCTGELIFSAFGRRKESYLQLMTLQGYRTGKSGTWRSGPSDLRDRVAPSRSYSSMARLSQNVFGDSPLRITALIEPPFVQFRDESTLGWRPGTMVEATTGRELEGMCIDILRELSAMLGFSFNISLVPDGKYGSRKPEPRGWTGMVRQLIDDKADVALAAFQMSVDRSIVVDFTKPFLTKGTTVVVKRPEHHLWIFQFLSPLSPVVWSAIFVAFVIVSLTLFGVSRVNSDRRLKYTSNMRESFWYIWGTLLRGSLNGSPHAISSRIVSSAWWFFCLIVSSIYTANLAAFLTITNSDIGINSAADLARQNMYDYGTVEGSQSEIFFKHTRMEDYAKMWAHMSTLSPDSMVRRVELGFERARKGGYAFIWDTPTIRHEISNDCELMEIGASFDNKGYAFATQRHAPYAEKLSWALLKLNDDGILYRLERKWWRPQVCPNQLQSAKTKSLDLQTVAGMYLVLLAGIGMAVLLCLLQFCVAKTRPSAKHRKKRKEETNDTTACQEPCLKISSDVSHGASPEAIQVYANHSPYSFRTTYTTAEW